jgi:TRAP-type C4-dicarboxylate transport system substrate-binding protein
MEVTMKKMLSVVATFVLMAVLLPCQGFAKDAEFTLKVHHFLPAKSNAQVLLIEPWANKITADSNGRIKVEIYPSMQLGGKPPHLFNQVKDGVADVVWTLPSYTPGRFPVTDLFELPYIAGSAEATTQALQEFSETYLKEEYGQIHPLLFHVPTPGLFHTASKQIKTMEDLKGMKIRTPSAIVTQSLEALGATPVGMPVPEVPQAMATEVIDGAVVPWEVVKALRLHELTKFHTQPGGNRGFYTSVFLFGMNKAKYDSMPADLQKVIDDNSGMNLAQKVGEAFDKADVEGQALGKERGNTFYTLSAEEVQRWQLATQSVIDTWVASMDKAGHDGKKMLATARELIKKYSKD